MKDKILKIVKENTMLIVLVLVVLFFNATTHGTMLMPSQFNALITQPARQVRADREGYREGCAGRDTP